MLQSLSMKLKQVQIFGHALWDHVSALHFVCALKRLITWLWSQMEICRNGFCTEDFRTQEVPAGFDFTSYGEFRGCRNSVCWSLSWGLLRRTAGVSVSSGCERLKDRGNTCAGSIITSVRAFSDRPWLQRRECRPAGWCWLWWCWGGGAQKLGGQVKDMLHVSPRFPVFSNPFLQTSSSNRFSVPLPIPPSLPCHTPSGGVSSRLFLPLPACFLRRIHPWSRRSERSSMQPSSGHDLFHHSQMYSWASTNLLLEAPNQWFLI